MKHYLYISDTKLDMMAAQIPRKLRDRIASELTLDLKVLSVSLRENRSEDTRYSKLELVTEYLTEHLSDKIGTIDDPGPYFGGTLEMRWGLLDEYERSAVYFAGYTERSIVALGGSVGHVIGGSDSIPPGLSSSLAPSLLDVLQAHSPEDVRDDFGPDVTAPGVRRARGRSPHENPVYLLLDPARDFAGHERVEFLARRLFRWTAAGEEVWDPGAAVLGSPIYVAAAD